MDKIDKALKKLSPTEKQAIAKILKLISEKSWSKLDRKKLKNHTDIYRVRSGQIRIIYHETQGGKIFVLAIERRNDKTYNF